MNLGPKITLSVFGVVFGVLIAGNWLIWNRLDTPELRRDHILLGIWTMVGVALLVWWVVGRITRPLQHSQAGLRQEVESQSQELERSQLQLLQAARMAAVGELAAGVAHEINNPASTILMRAATLDQALEDADPSVREDVQVIQRQVEKISRIVTALLTFSQRTDVTADEATLLDLNDVVVRTAALMDGILRSRQINVHLHLTPDVPPVRAEGSRIEQVLLNLVNNAVDAMPEGGSLQFSSSVRNGHVAVQVTDTGSGIAPAALDRVFDPFFTTKDPGQGTGLGLSVSFAIVEQHGGVIEVTSEPGKGSCFTLLLPAVAGGATKPEAPDVE